MSLERDLPFVQSVDCPERLMNAELSDGISLLSIKFRRFIGWLSLIPLSFVIILLLKMHARYKIADHKKIREKFKDLTKDKKPLIICANHLTLIDSIIIIWALASTTRYFFNYQLFSWNLPAVENTKKRFSWRVVTFLSKCLLIDRRGGASHTDSILNTVQQALRSNDTITIFPEGTRSRTGRFNSKEISYGVGYLLQDVPDANALCIYLRGRKQESYSDFPAKGEIFDLDMRLVKPSSFNVGLRGAKDLSMQIGETILKMEEEYFASR